MSVEVRGMDGADQWGKGYFWDGVSQNSIILPSDA